MELLHLVDIVATFVSSFVWVQETYTLAVPFLEAIFYNDNTTTMTNIISLPSLSVLRLTNIGLRYIILLILCTLHLQQSASKCSTHYTRIWF